MWQIQPYIFPVVPGRAGGGSFREIKTINQRKIAYRMCARRPTSAMPKPSFLCAPAFSRWLLLLFFILDIFLGLYYSFILLFFDSTILWLYYYFTLRCRSYIGSFSTITSFDYILMLRTFTKWRLVHMAHGMVPTENVVSTRKIVLARNW